MKDFYANYVLPANEQFAEIDPKYKELIYPIFSGISPILQRRYIEALVFTEVIELYLSGNFDKAFKVAGHLYIFHMFYWYNRELELISKGRLLN